MKSLRLGLAVGFLFAVGVGWAAEITLPPETSRLAESPLPGYPLATTYCYTCHSTDYIRYQPSTTSRAAWKAAVVKMQKVFRAPIPDEAIDPIAEYLVKTYGVEKATAAKPGVQPKFEKSSFESRAK